MKPPTARQHKQDLRLILQLLAVLLRHEPMLVSRLLAVSIVYNNNQTLDWVDVIIAALNVLPGLALATAASLPTGARQAAAAAHGSGGGDASDPAAFCWSLLHSMADCLAAAGVAAGSQPSRVLGALCGCALLHGVAEAAEPLEVVPLKGLAGCVQQQQSASRAGGADGGVNDWSQLTKLQVGAVERGAGARGWRLLVTCARQRRGGQLCCSLHHRHAQTRVPHRRCRSCWRCRLAPTR
jgi:hypothetical protein